MGQHSLYSDPVYLKPLKATTTLPRAGQKGFKRFGSGAKPVGSFKKTGTTTLEEKERAYGLKKKTTQPILKCKKK